MYFKTKRQSSADLKLVLVLAALENNSALQNLIKICTLGRALGKQNTVSDFVVCFDISINSNWGEKQGSEFYAMTVNFCEKYAELLYMTSHLQACLLSIV